MKIGFLIGAGVSKYANAPSTEDITKRLLEDNKIIKHSIGSFHYSNRDDQSKLLIKLIQDYLNFLKNEIVNYYEDLYKTNLKVLNYEILYYFAWQLWSSNAEEYENPAIRMINNKIKLKYKKKYQDYHEELYLSRDCNFTDFLKDSLIYIEDIVSELLELTLKTEHQGKYLKYILDSINDPMVQNVEIFTLNHDNLIEQIFKKKSIEYIDGFRQKDLVLKVWDSNLYKENSKVKLYKLHGSISWYRFFREDKNLWVVGNISKDIEDIDHILDTENNFIDRYPRHLLLIGTFNKMFYYLTDIFIELYYYFFNVLKEIDILIISGYSFGDKGINFNIRRWMEYRDKKLIIINKNPTKLKNTARGMISNNWENWKNAGKLQLINKNFEDAEWFIDRIY